MNVCMNCNNRLTMRLLKILSAHASKIWVLFTILELITPLLILKKLRATTPIIQITAHFPVWINHLAIFTISYLVLSKIYNLRTGRFKEELFLIAESLLVIYEGVLGIVLALVLIEINFNQVAPQLLLAITTVNALLKTTKLKSSLTFVLR